MTGYTGRPYTPTPAEASASRITHASTGAQDSMQGKVDAVARYINQYGGNIKDVPCPSAEEWGQLSRGRHAALPSEVQLALYADNQMRESAATCGGMRQAYFAFAKSQLLNQAA